MAKYIKTRKGNDGFYYPYTSPDLVIDEDGKSTTTKFSEINTQLENIGQSTQEQINTAIDKAIEEGKMHSDASKLSIIDENNNFMSDNVEGALEELNTQFKDIANQIESGNIGNNVEPLDDDLPNVYITGTLPTSKDQGDLPITIHYISKTLDFKEYGTLKVQGASSALYPKKNFTLKLYKDEGLTTKSKHIFKSWGKLSKFVLKAHWMDCSHVRNVGTAKIWGKIVQSRSDYDSLPNELKNSPNNGATDGFTVRMFANGIYQGLYECIVPKDKIFGQDSDNPNHSIATTEFNNQASCAFATTTPTISGNWSEELQDTMSTDISTSLANFIKFVNGSTDEDFVANAENYFDVQSVIDYDIFARIFCIVDNLCRNQIFFTYNGTKWYEGVWDLDAVLGLPPTTRGFYAYNTEFQTGYVAYNDYKVTNMLYQRVETLFMDRFKARYNELRSNILSNEGILEVYERLTNVIKTYDGLLEEDYASTTGNGNFAGIPYQKENNIQQIRNFLSKRLVYMDEVISNMVKPVSCTGISLDNSALEFTSSDTQTLIATVTPSDTTDAIIWTVDDDTIASVEGGVITPLKNGSCTITATCGSQTAECTITISGIAVRYSITNNLTNVTSNNSASSIEENGSYVATLTVNEGYSLSSCIVTMGGVDITSTSYSNKNININNVTGNVVINAVATEITDEFTTPSSISNLLEGSSWTNGYINATTGAIISNNNYRCIRNYITIPNTALWDTITFSKGNGENMTSTSRIVLYDENLGFVKSIDGGAQTSITLSAGNLPSNAKYIRVSINITDTSTTTLVGQKA